MSLPAQIALVPDGVDISMSELTTVAAALTHQVSHDFQPIWNVNATVSAFARLEDVPIDTWPIVIKQQLDAAGAAGYHQTKHHQPYAVVQYGSEWSLTASHECLEMLADPSGNRLKAGDLLPQAETLKKSPLPPARVNYLVEVCDPCEGRGYAYQIAGVLVSDFYTPRFFDPVKAPGVRYSFTGAIDAPRKILRDGYITWKDMKTEHFLQLCMFPDDVSSVVPHVVDLSTNKVFERLLGKGESLRAAVDAITRSPLSERPTRTKSGMQARQRATIAGEAQRLRADALRRAIATSARGVRQ